MRAPPPVASANAAPGNLDTAAHANKPPNSFRNPRRVLTLENLLSSFMLNCIVALHQRFAPLVHGKSVMRSCVRAIGISSIVSALP